MIITLIVIGVLAAGLYWAYQAGHLDRWLAKRGKRK